jgi:NADH:ubiquinone oxidoreductase subunit F (NADH-binding)
VPAAAGRRAPSELIELVTASGLRGRGGAGFPTGVKLRAVRDQRRAGIVLANGAEGEPASGKDRLLLAVVPHLVLDGAVLCARAIGAGEVVVAVGDHPTQAAVERALAERGRALDGRVAIGVTRVPEAFVAGEETALINHLDRGELKPTLTPPRPAERGLRRRPTLVQNVETLAHVALIARHGPDWFRRLGTPEDPGSALVTISGAVARPGVFEVATDTRLADLAAAAGGVTERLRAVLVGGYFGDWVDGEEFASLRLDDAALRPFGAKRGAGVLALLPESACGPAETADVLAYLASQSAGQCGPCVNGLPAIAAMVGRLVDGDAPADAMEHLGRWLRVVPGRGACRLPDGAVRFAASALAVFAAEFADHHRHGRCTGCATPAWLPVPPGTELAA